MITELLTIINIALSIFLAALFLNGRLVPKWSHRLTVALFFAVNLAVYVVALYCGVLPTVKISLSVVVLAGSALLLYKGTLNRKLRILGLLLLMLVVSEGAGALICFILSPEDFDILHLAVIKLIGLMFSNLIFAALAMAVAFVLSNKKNKWDWNSIAVITGVPVVQLVLCSPAFLGNTGGASQAVLLIMTLGVLVSAFADWAVYYSIKSGREKVDEDKQNEWLKTYHKLDLKYYELALEEAKKAKKLKHDILNYIQTIYTLFLSKNEKNKEIGIEMVEALRKRVTDIAETSYCENNIVNVVLTLKTNSAKDYGITTDIIVELPENVTVDKMDLCSVFVNLYDNAIEACRHNETARNIEIRAGIKFDYLIIKFTNTVETPVTDTDKLVTTKKDKYSHGWGLKILREIAARYEGDLKLASDNGQFVSMIMLKC